MEVWDKRSKAVEDGSLVVLLHLNRYLFCDKLGASYSRNMSRTLGCWDGVAVSYGLPQSTLALAVA